MAFTVIARRGLGGFGRFFFGGAGGDSLLAEGVIYLQFDDELEEFDVEFVGG